MLPSTAIQVLQFRAAGIGRSFGDKKDQRLLFHPVEDGPLACTGRWRAARRLRLGGASSKHDQQQHEKADDDHWAGSIAARPSIYKVAIYAAILNKPGRPALPGCKFVRHPLTEPVLAAENIGQPIRHAYLHS